ncbi:hypothetical protein PP178_04300 [Zeaxanthinibacter sp. PT1]|uniref:hypothetical protein n=1 Tax=Zeaxanthinibacter TaxID=561554 RepID=UPI00234BC8E1|nr:hypothetical protein [Zeaxanthinibacter sp. PT1]MDC6350761.1 hypothetical protein [Zeaxanthinibacter sp. PT1]
MSKALLEKYQCQVTPGTEDDTYGGAHNYVAKNCLGFHDGETVYTDSVEEISFIKKNDDGTIEAGFQSEQLLAILIDRHEKLNARFPSDHGEAAILRMKQALLSLQARVAERKARGVMGELKK